MHQLSALGMVFSPERETNITLHLPDTLNLKRILLFTSVRNLRLNSSRIYLTQLSLIHIPIDVCINLFFECRNLIEFNCSCPTNPIEVQAPCVPSSPIFSEFLSKLSWEVQGSGSTCWDELLLKHTRFPALTRLSWTNKVLPHPNPSTTSFFTNLPRSLDTLTLNDVYGQETTWHDIRYDVDIRTLEIVECNQSFLHNVFQHISKNVIGSDEWVIPFPNLTRISYLFDCLAMPSWSLGSEIGEDLVLFLEERIGLIDQFTFWTSNHGLPWNKDIWRRLQEFQAGVLALTIGERGKTVDILSKCNT
jgi:hypothetical protein